ASTSPQPSGAESDRLPNIMDSDVFHFLHGALNAPQTKHRTLMHLGRSLMEDNLQSPTAEQAVNWKLATACGFPLEPAEKSWLHHELLGSLGYTFLASVGPLERTPHWILASDEWFRRVQNVDTALETLRKAAEELVSVLEKHGAQAFHVSSPLYYEAGSGLSQDVTLLLSRQGAYNKGDACPVQRLANADQGVFIVEHKESCMWCEQGALKEDCRPLAAARVKKHQFALASGISPFGENDAPVAALITDLLRKGGVPCPWLPIQEEEYERNLPIPADLSEDGLRATR
ncbi:unnamed protein product, partial [Durusdinium trenchii]